MKRYENVDMLRSLAIITIIVYHCFAITMPTLSHVLYVDKLIGYGGEIGVTLFFVLSGFGIAYSIINAENKDGKGYTWIAFMKKRITRIVQQYYVCLAIMLLLTDCAGFLLTPQGILHIFSHIFFFQNLFVTTHGSINGAMWALATIFQFYLIALPLQKLIEKNKWIILFLAIIVSIGSKCLIYNYIAHNTELNGTYFFVYGRQLLDTLDNFVVGMVIAKVCTERKQDKKWYWWIGVIVLFVVMIFWITVIDKIGLYTNNLLSYIWHSVLALILAGILFCFNRCPFPFKYIKKFLLWLSKYEYGIYIWHIVLIYNLIGKSPLFQLIRSQTFYMFTVVILIVSIFMGFFSTKFIDKK